MIRINISSVAEASVTKKFSGSGRLSDDTYVDRPFFQQTGFTSIPKADTKGIAEIIGNQVIMIATSDEQADRPVLSSETDVAIYADADKYIKIAADGEIEASNGSGKIILKANGDIELGEGTLKKLLNEAAATLYNNHGHEYILPGPTVLISSTPTTAVLPPVVAAPMGSSHMTSKTEAE